MHSNSVSSTGEGQSPIDLSGCRSALIPGTGIRLIIPSPEAELRLSVQLDIPGRFKAIRSDALRDLAPGAEAFAMRTYGVGGGIYLSVSILTTRQSWRGGWVAYLCPPGEETKLVAYLEAARDAVVADLRKERLQRGSKS
jgi:hypothetical protein